MPSCAARGRNERCVRLGRRSWWRSCRRKLRRRPHGDSHGGGWGRGGGWHGGGYGGVIIASPIPGGPFPIPYPSPYPVPYPVPPPGPYPAPAPYPPSGTAGSGDYASLPPAWFYCDGPKSFYPYVKSCAYDWEPVPIAPPPPDRAPRHYCKAGPTAMTGRAIIPM